MRMVQGRWTRTPLLQLYLCVWIRACVDHPPQGGQIVPGGIDTAAIVSTSRHPGFVDCKVLWIRVRRDEIDGEIVRLAILHEVGDPDGNPRNRVWIEWFTGSLGL